MNTPTASRAILLALACAAFTTTALAQWQWVDKDGRKVFSDRSPPADIEEKSILRRPSGSSVKSIATAPAGEEGSAKPAAAAVTAKVAAPKVSGKDAELEARKKKADDEETAKKKAEDEKVAKSRADNCDRAKGGLATLQSGVRMASVGPNGERQIYDDAKRSAETQRAQELIDSNCK
jgi:Domain of unknown function (DUF4124)